MLRIAMKEATIIGAGLAGTLLAIYLAKRGYKLSIFDARPDSRQHSDDKGRSINLALSCRGLTALTDVGLLDQVKKIMVPMRARAIHYLDKPVKYQSFGRHYDEYINAIQRSDLNKLLLDEADKYLEVNFHFEHKLLDVDSEKKQLVIQSNDDQVYRHSYKMLIGADGAGSLVRESLIKNKLIQANRNFLDYGYKELSIGEPFQNNLAHEHLHLWPRDAFLLLGNPNRDKSITGSLFLPHEGPNSFAQLNNDEQITHFFKANFPDAYLNMPYLLDEFNHHPTGNMSTIHCNPWYHKECLLIGDAAHGVVPFFGQGMNSAFEDCRVLNTLLNNNSDNWEHTCANFYEARKVNTEAVAQMSMDNFKEIQTDISNPQFNLKKQIELHLMTHFPDKYVSKHVLVMFTNTPYSKALQVGMLQSDFLNTICKDVSQVNDINWNDSEKLFSDYDKKLATIIN